MGAALSTPVAATPSAATPSKDNEFLNCKNDYELAIKTSKDLEYVLERHFGAHGRGLLDKISTAEGLSPDLDRDMRYLATIRNKLIHQRGFDSIPDRRLFRERFIRSSEELERLIRERSRSNWEHFMGDTSKTDTAVKVLRERDALEYRGETSPYQYETYVLQHISFQSILDSLKMQGVYQEPIENAQVEAFLNGIKCPQMNETVLSLKRSLPTHNDFTYIVAQVRAAVQCIFQEERPPITMSAGVAVSSVSHADASKKRTTGSTVQIRYYTKEEYDNMSKEDKNELRKMRLAQGHKSKKRTNGDNNNGSQRGNKKARTEPRESAKLPTIKEVAEQVTAVQNNLDGLTRAIIALRSAGHEDGPMFVNQDRPA